MREHEKIGRLDANRRRAEQDAYDEVFARVLGEIMNED